MTNVAVALVLVAYLAYSVTTREHPRIRGDVTPHVESERMIRGDNDD